MHLGRREPDLNIKSPRRSPSAGFLCPERSLAPAQEDAEIHRAEERRKRGGKAGKVDALRQPGDSGVAEHAQRGKACKDQHADEQAERRPALDELELSIPAAPELKLTQQRVLVLIALDEEVCAGEDPPAPAAHPAFYYVVASVFPEPLDLEQLFGGRGQTAPVGDAAQELLHLSRPGGEAHNPAPEAHRSSGVESIEPVIRREEKDRGVLQAAPPQQHGQRRSQCRHAEAEHGGKELPRQAEPKGQPDPAADEQQHEQGYPKNAADRAPREPAAPARVRGHPYLFGLHPRPTLSHLEKVYCILAANAMRSLRSRRRAKVFCGECGNYALYFIDIRPHMVIIVLL